MHYGKAGSAPLYKIFLISPLSPQSLGFFAVTRAMFGLGCDYWHIRGNHPIPAGLSCSWLDISIWQALVLRAERVQEGQEAAALNASVS
jgi:hypothetical protein